MELSKIKQELEAMDKPLSPECQQNYAMKVLNNVDSFLPGFLRNCEDQIVGGILFHYANLLRNTIEIKNELKKKCPDLPPEEILDQLKQKFDNYKIPLCGCLDD